VKATSRSRALEQAMSESKSTWVPKSYVVTRADAANASVKVGDIVYDLKSWDYGLAGDDSRITGVPHVSVTLDPTGDYPSFTIPEHCLRERK